MSDKPKKSRGKPFAKGKSGNPGGRPKELESIRGAARLAAPDALKALTRLAMSSSTPPAARVAACREILDRAYGKPTQAVELSGDVGMTLDSVFANVLKSRDEPKPDDAEPKPDDEPGSDGE
jgi:hypothetical protein